jgi:hypothetical protein
MNILMNYDYATMIVDSKGWDAFLEYLQNRFKAFNLYCVSTAWYGDDQYICKAKGTRGDVVISWEHKQKNIG